MNEFKDSNAGKIGNDPLLDFPAFKNPIPVCKPFVPRREQFLEYINDILDRQWYTNEGPYVQELEKRLADFHGVQYCSLVCNATLGLQLVIQGLDLTGQIILPSFTFIASAHAPFWQGIEPVFCDVEPQYCTIDPAKAEKLITPRTTAIMGVHIFSNVCRIDELSDICQKHGLKLIFDAAHAFACSYKGRTIGNFGDAEVLSFHATKFYSTLEGGAILTNNAKLYQRLKWLKNFGFSDYDQVDYLGTNAKMNEVCAAFGLTGLDSINERIDWNRSIRDRYREGLNNVPGLRFLELNPEMSHNYQYIVIFIDEIEFDLSRDMLYEFLWEHNIFARRYFYPGCHRMEPYRSLQPWSSKLLPQTENLLSQVLCLPCYHSLSLEEVDIICELIVAAHQRAGDCIEWIRKKS